MTRNGMNCVLLVTVMGLTTGTSVAQHSTGTVFTTSEHFALGTLSDNIENADGRLRVQDPASDLRAQ